MELTGSAASNSSVFVTPMTAMSSRVTVWTGREVSDCTRLIDDPVISTRCTCCEGWSVACAWARGRSEARPPKTSRRLELILVRWNMRDPPGLGWNVRREPAVKQAICRLLGGDERVAKTAKYCQFGLRRRPPETLFVPLDCCWKAAMSGACWTLQTRYRCGFQASEPDTSLDRFRQA